MAWLMTGSHRRAGGLLVALVLTSGIAPARGDDRPRVYFLVHTDTKSAVLEKGPQEKLPKLSVTVFGRYRDFEDAMAARHPDRRTRAGALATAVQIAMAINQMPRGNEYFLRLGAEYPESPMLGFLRARYAPDRVLRVGVAVPSFHFAALTDSTQSYTRESMLGKVYLLDFWATWCGPCIGDMPYLHAAFDTLHAKGLEILSVSLDQDPGDVTKFLTGEWKMPWQHAFARGGFTNPSMRQFEIVFIPRMALVGRDGNIIAVDDNLRGEKILPTLRQALQTTQ